MADAKKPAMTPKSSPLKAELLEKERELAVEASLEKVRAAALVMKEPADMLGICRIISRQLKKLGVKEIRNVQTAVFHPEKGTYTNFEYYAKHDLTLTTEVDYTDHEMTRSFSERMMAGAGKMFSHALKGKEVQEWYSFQQQTNQFADKYLAKADSLNYYWYSLGPVAMGLSMYRPLSKEESGLFKRFRKVFELAYTRYLDIEKALAAAREARIEASLERVRAQAMGMRRSEELSNISESIFTELRSFGFSGLRNTEILVNNDPRETVTSYYYSDYGVTGVIEINYKENSTVRSWAEELRKDSGSFAAIEITEAEMEAWRAYRLKIGYQPDPQLDQARSVHYYSYSTGLGALSISSFSPISQEQLVLLERFKNVFGLAYRRYADVIQAENQAREAQIELALERVRSKTMAMHDSQDVGDTVAALFDALLELGVKTNRCGILIYGDTDITEVWTAKSNPEGRATLIIGRLDMTVHTLLQGSRQSWKDQEPVFSYALIGEDLVAYYKAINATRYYPTQFNLKQLPSREFHTDFFFREGCIFAFTPEPIAGEAAAILKRFAGVFGQTYRRYLDLIKAETQAREARIEAALEKVRSSSLAMHKSDDLQGVVNTVIEKLRELELVFDTGNILIFKEDRSGMEMWTGTNSTQKIQSAGWDLPFDISVQFDHWREAFESGQDLILKTFPFDEKNEMFGQLFTQTEFRNLPEERKSMILESKFATILAALVKDIGIQVISYSREVFPSGEIEILKRFAKVFHQAYVRFLDLKKAEAQAHEAQIEASLERVRAKAMAMHDSKDMERTANTVFVELQRLGIRTIRLGIGILSAEHFMSTLYASAESRASHYSTDVSDAEGSLSLVGTVDMTTHPSMLLQYEAWKRNEVFMMRLTPGEIQSYYENLGRHLGRSLRTASESKSEEYGCYLPFSFGLFFAWSLLPFPPGEVTVMERFKGVLELTFKRYFDLRNAEAQTREAQIEAALEKVRSRSLAMHHTSELEEVVKSMFDRLVELGVQFDGAGIYLFEKEKSRIDLWVASKVSIPLRVDLPYDVHVADNPIHKDLWALSEKGEDVMNKCYSGPAKDEYFRYIRRYNGSSIPEPVMTMMIEAENWTASFAAQKNCVLVIDSWEGRLASSEEFQIIQRFSKVFEQAYTRFLDLKKAEAQAREAQIESALERVRSRTMAMQYSQELTDVASVLFKQVQELGIMTWTTGFNVWSDDGESFTDYITSPQGGFIEPYTIQTSATYYSRDMGEARRSGVDFYVQYAEGDKLKEAYLALSASGPKQYETMLRDGFQFPSHQYDHFVFGSKASLMFITFEPVPEAHEVFRRFGNVFEQTFTRFLDLKRAEAQAREAQIEAALEKVRSRAMAMQKPGELIEVAELLRKEMGQLGVEELETSSIYIVDGEKKQAECWYAIKDVRGEDTKLVSDEMSLLLTETWVGREMWDFYASGEGQVSILMKGDNRKEWINYCAAHSAVLEGYYGDEIPERTYHLVKFSGGYMGAAAPGDISKESWDLLKRLSMVFSLAYTRFIDLQDASARAREAQIELALERVRTRTMTMQHSDELPEVANLLFHQVRNLDIPAWTCGFNIWEKDAEVCTGWMSTQGMLQPPFRIPLTESPTFIRFRESRLNGEDFFAEEVGGEALASHYRYMFSLPDFSRIASDQMDAGVSLPDRQVHNVANFSQGNLIFITHDPVPESTDTFKRFAKVFDLTYTRFLDLKKAEAQARDAKVEAGLERVRAKAMAMHKSEDLQQTIKTFYQELGLLGETPRRMGVGLVNRDTHMAEISTMNTTEEGEAMEVIGKLLLKGHLVLEGIYDHFVTQQEYRPVLKGNQIKEYYQLIRPSIAYPDYPTDMVQHGYFFYFSEGGVFAWTESELAEDELQIFRRFTSVMNLTYKRYKDLKDAEHRAQLAIRQASLDRVRAEIASMRTAEDLQRITPLVWRELTALGVPFFRCGIFIMSKEDGKVHMYLSRPDGQPLAAVHIPFDSSDTTREAVSHWQQQKSYTTHWDKEQFKEWVRSLMSQGQLQGAAGYQGGIEPPESLTLQFVPFVQGMLYVGSTEPLTGEQVDLAKELADAFSVAYARYEDFTRLEAAKEQVELALNELRSTQSQLVQSEKMASLGELTAGIAHEIQNPLNFVNNFAEVNRELLEDIRLQVANLRKGEGDNQELDELLGDVDLNMEKIALHGKRADGIVKSMLQHSRTSSGQKEPTDINALADEYLKLSYHGMRAKDKSFNVTMETHFALDAGKVEIIPQDIGRVLLNLFNNAFYAVMERKKNGEEGFDPKVILRTKRYPATGTLEIKVEDNGTGMPEEVREKIFQPFFTTKPTGQGTGLGLSLSYDMVTKGHGGELKVESEQGMGTVFTVVLP
jgi:signal transduction histidine kinase